MISKALSIALFVALGIHAAGCDASETTADEDLRYALSLLEAAGLDVEPQHIQRVLRDEIETVVWVSSTLEGLPVFSHNRGYVFERDGQPATEPGSDTPLRLGPPLADRSAFPLDHRPDIAQSASFEIYKERLEQESLPFAPDPDEELVAVLGFYNLNLADGDAPVYRLAWRVTPSGSEAPETIVSAKKGDVLFFDSGIRTSRVSNAGPIVLVGRGDDEPDQEPFIGTWYGPRRLERSYTRRLTINTDGTFDSRDLVSPCPVGARCVWSGIVTRSGTWRLDRGKIDLTQNAESSPAPGEPLATLLDWFPTENKLVEVVVGGPMTCEYRRKGSQSAGSEPEVGTVSACHDAVQDRIAWNYRGSTQWAAQNVERLCAGVEDSTEPAACFEEVMHGGVPGETNTKWHWQDALKLCAGTTSMERTLGCYRAEYHTGSSSEAAVEACRSSRR